MSEESNRSTINEKLEDGRKILSRSGKTYTLKQYQILDYTDRNGENKQLVAYNVQNSGKKKIGTVTQYTTEERLSSLLNRYEEPEHMKEFELICRIGSTNGLLYIVLPEPYRTYNDVLVDDEIKIEIENSKKQIVSDFMLHVSKIKTTYIINLSRLRRCIINEDGKAAILSIQDFKKTEQSNLFIKKGDLIKVKISPDPYQNYFLADSIMEDVKLLKDRSRNE